MTAILSIIASSSVLPVKFINLLSKMVEAIKTRETPIILILLMLNKICLECSHVSMNIISKTKASVIAVPSATPNAGLFLNITKPKSNEKPIFVIAPNRSVNK